MGGAAGDLEPVDLVGPGALRSALTLSGVEADFLPAIIIIFLVSYYFFLSGLLKLLILILLQLYKVF